MASLMLASVYDAQIDAGASEAKARSAAIDVAGYDDRLSSVERKLDRLDVKIDCVDGKIDGLEKRVNIQFGILAAMIAAILVRTFV